MGIANYAFPLMYGETTPNVFKIWGILGGQAFKCHMGMKTRCKIFYEQLNQNVIYQGDSWYVQGESRRMKNHQTCAHIDGAFIQLDSP
jgi:hypothetical protein